MTGEGVLWLATIHNAFPIRSSALTHSNAPHRPGCGHTELRPARAPSAPASSCASATMAVTIRRSVRPAPADADITPPLRSVGDGFNNALAENLLSTIKIELSYWSATTFDTRADAETALLRYIDGWYIPDALGRTRRPVSGRV